MARWAKPYIGPDDVIGKLIGGLRSGVDKASQEALLMAQDLVPYEHGALMESGRIHNGRRRGGLILSRTIRFGDENTRYAHIQERGWNIYHTRLSRVEQGVDGPHQNSTYVAVLRKFREGQRPIGSYTTAGTGAHYLERTLDAMAGNDRFKKVTAEQVRLSLRQVTSDKVQDRILGPSWL